jgi:hypothetical protein
VILYVLKKTREEAKGKGAGAWSQCVSILCFFSRQVLSVDSVVGRENERFQSLSLMVSSLLG